MIEQDVFFEGGDDGFTGELCLPMEVGSELIDENTLNEIPYQMEELNQLITVIILSLSLPLFFFSGSIDHSAWSQNFWCHFSNFFFEAFMEALGPEGPAPQAKIWKNLTCTNEFY